MPNEAMAARPRKIAVIGAGISGMGAAHRLAEDHTVVLFESEKRLGGHARTRMAGPEKDVPVDTGFIVFNYVNYPHLTRLFEHLNVPVVESNMSFAASFGDGEFEYALQSLNSLFGQRGNLINPAFYRMLRDLAVFNSKGVEASQEPGMTVAGLIEKLRLSDFFRDHYLLPFSGAIWSTPKDQIMDFPAASLLKFFDNHALLSTTGQHQWYTVRGGSQSYVSLLGQDLVQRGVNVRLDAAVDGVRRTLNGVEVKSVGQEWEEFDEVIFATHSDITLRLLSDPSEAERNILEAIRYQTNSVVLHSDTSIMPKRKRVWASWNYTEGKDKVVDQIDLTYWMNSLQTLDTRDNYMVTLNSTRPIRDELIWDECDLHHPVYDAAAIAAQQQARVINGTNRTCFK
jgi:predicted NAD/FAD-binding protein